MSVCLSVSASIYQCLRVGSFCAEKVCSSRNFVNCYLLSLWYRESVYMIMHMRVGAYFYFSVVSSNMQGKAMANYPQEPAQDAVCQSHTGHMTGLWFLPTRPLRLNTNEWMSSNMLDMRPCETGLTLGALTLGCEMICVKRSWEKVQFLIR